MTPKGKPAPRCPHRVTGPGQPGQRYAKQVPFLELSDLLTPGNAAGRGVEAFTRPPQNECPAHPALVTCSSSHLLCHSAQVRQAPAISLLMGGRQSEGPWDDDVPTLGACVSHLNVNRDLAAVVQLETLSWRYYATSAHGVDVTAGPLQEGGGRVRGGAPPARGKQRLE